MRALKKLKWKGLRAQQSHLDANDKLAEWQNEEMMRQSGEDPIGPNCFAESVTFLIKLARRSQKRQQLFKLLSTECRMIHEDCRQAIETQNLKPKQRKKLENRMREAAAEQGFMDGWVKDEAGWFGYINDYIDDVFERFTDLYKREDLSKDVNYEVSPELEPGEFPDKPVVLTRH